MPYRPYNHIFYNISNFHDHDLLLKYRYLGSSSSAGDLVYTMTSAAFRSLEKIISLKLNVQISRTKPKRHAMHSICPLILFCRLAASGSRITLWAQADKLYESYLSQIQCSNLEKGAKTTRKVTNVSVNSTQAVNRQPGFRLKDSQSSLILYELNI